MSPGVPRALLCALLVSIPSGAFEIPAAEPPQQPSSHYGEHSVARTAPLMVEQLSSHSCGSEVCDETTDEYCIVNETHQYAYYDEGPPHCKFGSDTLKLWVTSSGTIQCSAPCLDPDAPYFGDLTCGCSISLTFPMGVWLDPNAVIQAAVVNVNGRPARRPANQGPLQIG